MGEERIYSLLLLAVFFPTVLANHNKDVPESNVDIAQFLKQSWNLWVYNTTEPGTVTCRNDVYHNVTEQETLFTRYFLNNTRHEKNLKGTFFREEDGNPLKTEKYNAIRITDSMEESREYPLGKIFLNIKAPISHVLS
uniref:Lipocalin-3 1 n=1 Tax=Amblyomma triste TaxID=251400 RepID=A0A023G4R6_AMBTT